MTNESRHPPAISEERREEIYEACHWTEERESQERSSDSLEAFTADSARIADYVDAEIAKAVDFRDSGEALKMQARALEVVHKVQVREAVKAALEEFGRAAIDECERWTFPQGVQKGVRRLLAEQGIEVKCG